MRVLFYVQMWTIDVFPLDRTMKGSTARDHRKTRPGSTQISYQSSWRPILIQQKIASNCRWVFHRTIPPRIAVTSIMMRLKMVQNWTNFTDPRSHRRSMFASCVCVQSETGWQEKFNIARTNLIGQTSSHFGPSWGHSRLIEKWWLRTFLMNCAQPSFRYQIKGNLK